MFLTGSQAIFNFAQTNLYSIVDSKETSTLHLSNIEKIMDLFKKNGKNIFSTSLSEYKNLQDLTGNISKEKNAIEGIGGEMVFTNDSFTFSSTQLLNKYFSVFSSYSLPL